MAFQGGDANEKGASPCDCVGPLTARMAPAGGGGRRSEPTLPSTPPNAAAVPEVRKSYREQIARAGSPWLSGLLGSLYRTAESIAASSTTPPCSCANSRARVQFQYEYSAPRSRSISA